MNTPIPNHEVATQAPAWPIDHIDTDDLAASQLELSEQLTALINELALSLERDNIARNPADADGSELLPDGVASLQSAARWREGQAKQRRQLAQDMVFSALRNLDNPDWRTDAADPTQAAGSGALLQALLSWPAPD
jgi:hypothetical protein